MRCARAVRKVGHFPPPDSGGPLDIISSVLEHMESKYIWFQCMFLDKCDVENTICFNCTFLDSSMQRFCRWVVFRGIVGIFGAVRALCENAPKRIMYCDNDQCDGATRLILYVEFGTQIVFVL